MIYSIKRGNHFSYPRLSIFKLISFKNDEFRVRFNFLNSFESEFPDQWNKLCGISYSLFPNKNAIMIGYRCNENRIQIAPYVNQDYKWNISDIYECNIGDEYIINACNSNFNFNVVLLSNSKVIHRFKSIKCPGPTFIGTKRQPYHGGRGLSLSDYKIGLNYF
jgi:hypothetical protein